MNTATLMGILFMVLIFTGIPISFATGLATAAYFFLSDMPTLVVPMRLFNTVDSFSLLAIPLFMLAGDLMNAGGITKRIVEFSSTLVGHITGGLAHITILASMIFAGMSGSCTAAGASVGSMMIPALKKDGYRPEFGVAVVAAAAVLGPVIPPSIIMVIYASCTGSSVGRLFLGGVVPGLIIGLLLMIVAYIISRKEGYKPKYEKWVGPQAVISSFWHSLPALILPCIIIGGILGGVFTATEAGVVGVVYAAIVGFYFKEIRIRDLKPIFLNAAKTSTNILFLMGTSATLGWILTSIQLPQKMTVFLVGISPDPAVLTLIMLAFVLFLGCFMTDAAIVPILAPLLIPVIRQVGIDPIMFGVVLCTTAVAGNLTPPVGGLLFVTSAIGNVSVITVAKHVLPFLGAIILALILCTVFPSLVSALPTMMLGAGR
ncbi:membrane protein [Betaproteobacteria bacterium]|nr:membrane protein [Betaproteobacteria bacterium]